jgi:hypothetical protein
MTYASVRPARTKSNQEPLGAVATAFAAGACLVATALAFDLDDEAGVLTLAAFAVLAVLIDFVDLPATVAAGRSARTFAAPGVGFEVQAHVSPIRAQAAPVVAFPKVMVVPSCFPAGSNSAMELPALASAILVSADVRAIYPRPRLMRR